MQDRRHSIAPQTQVRVAASLVAVWAGALVAVAFARLQQAADVEALFLDAAYLTGSPWYTGLFTNVAILAWTVAATAAAGGAWVAHRIGRASVVPFLASSAAVTAWLLADDLLQFHADLLPALGLTPTVAKAAIVAPVPLWLIGNHREILRTRWFLLSAALAAFFTSLVVEAGSVESTMALVLEDTAKLLGVLAWAHYFVTTTVDITRSVINEALGARNVTPPSTTVDHHEDEPTPVPTLRTHVTERRGRFPKA